MHKILLISIIILFFVSFASFAQMTVEEYQTEKENLTNRKIELQTEIANLKVEIDSLYNLIPQKEQEIQTAFRELYVLKYGKEIGERVLYKRVWKGMTEKLLNDSWGKPDKIDKNIEKWGVFTQWYYGDVIFFFRDGKLTDWEGEQEK